MNPDLPRLIPGITSIFTDAGFSVNVTEVGDEISITVSKGSVTASQSFPYPAVNRDLSIPLMAWKVQLITQESNP